MLLALLFPDPCDPFCPEHFKEKARQLLPRVQGVGGSTDEDLRQALLKFIGDFANWDLSNDATYLEISRGLVKAAHPDESPLVVDPFAGGGSIPLEALRVGCDVFASDLNPVACLILKVLLEDIPRYGPDLAEELRRVGAEVKAAAEKDLAEFYPADPGGARPIAYIWARVVRCDDCGAEIPLVRSWWLSKKAKRKRALRYRIVRGRPPRVELELFEPKDDSDVPTGTVSRAKARCLCCPSVLPPERVRAQLVAQRGGADVAFGKDGERTGGARLLAVVTLKDGDEGRRYRLAMNRDYEAVRNAVDRLKRVAAKRLETGLSPVPDEPSPTGGGSGAGRAFSVQKYGMMTFGDLFTSRQKLALVTLATKPRLEAKVARVFAMTVDGVVDRNAVLCSWRPQADQEKVEHVFTRQALPMTWDFAEAQPLSESTGSFSDRLAVIAGAIELHRLSGSAQSSLNDARKLTLPDAAAAVWFTDPPYYDAVPYADLSDFFYVWLKRVAASGVVRSDPYNSTNVLTPKAQEAVQDETRVVDGTPKDRLFFERVMAEAFAEGRRVLADVGVGSVVFAHKTTEGWEALLSGMIRGGWIITGSWPVATEMATRLRARESAALATSVHLVCRPRIDALVGDWAHVRRELPKRVTEWMGRLQDEGVRGADLVFACIGPALEIYSRYVKVVDANDREIPLGGDPEATEPHKRGYLSYVWEVVGRAALEQVLGQAESKAKNGAAGAVEEDARLTALFLWTLQSTAGMANGNRDAAGEDEEEEEEGGAKKMKKGLTLPYDVVRRFAQPLGIHLDRWEDRVIEQDKGVVRLLPVAERAQQLFGEEGAPGVARELERSTAGRAQITLFPEAGDSAPPRIKGSRRKGTSGTDETLGGRPEATTLDRVHAGMLLQRAGRTQALRRLLEDQQERGPDFLRLANALSALYPKESDEKRLLDAMLLAVPR